ncbi:MAG TPA: PIN domain nuclease, partial [Candidatus Blackburnbacteria bacterium]|nr:PIN domain nuclease [Candidatus Blackburnbacteria bacterium]
AVEISKKYEVSVYGASYVVLAKEKKCKLYTADAKFVSLVNLPFVKNLADYS